MFLVEPARPGGFSPSPFDFCPAARVGGFSPSPFDWWCAGGEVEAYFRINFGEALLKHLRALSALKHLRVLTVFVPNFRGEALFSAPVFDTAVFPVSAWSSPCDGLFLAEALDLLEFLLLRLRFRLGVSPISCCFTPLPSSAFEIGPWFLFESFDSIVVAFGGLVWLLLLRRRLANSLWKTCCSLAASALGGFGGKVTGYATLEPS